MTPLTSITGLSTEAADLLTAAGIRSTAHLAREEPNRLHSRLEMIAWQRGRAASAPAVEQLDHWIRVAAMLTPAADAEALSVDDIPEATTGPNAGHAAPPPPSRPATPASGPARPNGDRMDPRPQSDQSDLKDDIWRKVDPNKFVTIDAYNEGRTRVQPLSRDSIAGPTGVTETPSDEARESPTPRRTQRIRSNGDQLSRWVRRGVVHPRPFHTWLGALVSLVWRLAFVAGIAGFLYLILGVEKPSDYQTEVIAGSIILVILACMQLHFAGRSRCRICSCNLFHSKNCLKNRKAHHIPGFGYVASLALHLLIFGWFRCMYCGTAIRLKPSAQR